MEHQEETSLTSRNMCPTGVNNYIGNMKFREIVHAYKMAYHAASKVDKPYVAREVVGAWRQLSPPGRFLARRSDGKRGSGSVMDPNNVWYDVGNTKARHKASQCLRELTTDVLPYIKQLREHSKMQNRQPPYVSPSTIPPLALSGPPLSYAAAIPHSSLIVPFEIQTTTSQYHFSPAMSWHSVFDSWRLEHQVCRSLHWRNLPAKCFHQKDGSENDLPVDTLKHQTWSTVSTSDLYQCVSVNDNINTEKDQCTENQSCDGSEDASSIANPAVNSDEKILSSDEYRDQLERFIRCSQEIEVDDELQDDWEKELHHTWRKQQQQGQAHKGRGVQPNMPCASHSIKSATLSMISSLTGLAGSDSSIHEDLHLEMTKSICSNWSFTSWMTDLSTVNKNFSWLQDEE
jgi:hypothetical protein